MNTLPKLLLIINLIHSIYCVNLDFTSKFNGNAKRNADKFPSTSNKISKLRLILLSDLKQNEIQQPIDSCWSSSQTLKITAKSCPCNQINCNAPTNDAKRRAISATCMQICCGNRYKKASIRSLSESQLQELRKFSLKTNCEKSNHTNSLVFARIYEKFNEKSICAGVLVHQKFLVTTAICVSNKKPSDLIIKFGSDHKDEVKDIFTHPDFYKTMDTLQDNIALLMLEREIYDGDLPCIIKYNVDDSRCHVYSWAPWRFARIFENSMKVDNVEVFTRGECYTSHLISGNHHEKYVSKGNNNICVGNVNRYQLDINLSGSALTCHQNYPTKPTVLKGLLTWSTEVNYYPHLFTDITQFTDWIERTVNEKYLNSI
ncbi:CLUMA_CG009675, isoform A [Clunio marinus]|uniref:CLUMA_CG009675, isoform A n=1 Tax=Clunio marinus TaxID=568069 RepID=A0A1J1I7L0_9DIPT|nr:CLUMA_CG009675, isoform A [Clunio marinus]